MWKTVKSIQRKAGKFKVYNISVENNENYFANGFLVHNCFSYYQKSHSNSAIKTTTYNDYQRAPLKWVSVELIKQIFLLKKKSQFSDFIKKKIVMQWGGLADPFDEYERKCGKTLELLKFFDSIDYPLSFSTKAIWFTKDKRYVDLIKKHKHNWHFKISIINLDKNYSRKLEKGCPSPQERLKAIKRLSKLGLHVTLRLRPFIIGYSDKNNEYRRLIKLAAKNGADSVSTEFFCLEQRADLYLKSRYKEMSKIVGFDIQGFYKKHSLKRGYLRLNYNIKKRYIKKIKALCDKLNLRFYVSDAHHKEKCANGSCCGLPVIFNYSRGQFTEALMIAKEKGIVRFKDIEKNIMSFKKIMWSKAQGFNTKNNLSRLKAGKMTLFEFIRTSWNNPNSCNSPYKYFNGILKPVKVDKEGNIIYKYDYELAKI